MPAAKGNICHVLKVVKPPEIFIAAPCGIIRNAQPSRPKRQPGGKRCRDRMEDLRVGFVAGCRKARSQSGSGYTGALSIMAIWPARSSLSRRAGPGIVLVFTASGLLLPVQRSPAAKMRLRATVAARPRPAGARFDLDQSPRRLSAWRWTPLPLRSRSPTLAAVTPRVSHRFSLWALPVHDAQRWLVGRHAAAHIAGWDHWLAFGLLGLVGGKCSGISREKKFDSRRTRPRFSLVILSAATTRRPGDWLEHAC